ncbi:hypothetical protein D7Z26_15165 [Cohnella endophytica]|uniref:ABC transporter permease n=1 Tax=Cohnella endophytica TaxID=2419778 RepID=A0A494XZV2_9BACL|nr:ABC-2 family transporter protein [Cohnella endophytica]RKP53073.1 hypothetical protein D7Z26_15165 [Cohnella endophytica]
MHGIRLYLRFVIIYLKTKIEYDHFFVFMDLVLNSIWPLVNLTMLWIMLDRFGQIDGWDFDQLMFLFNLSHMAYLVCAVIIWNPTREMQELVRSGGFDAYLIRPIHPLAHLIMRQFSHGHFFGLVVSVSILIYNVNRLQLDVTIGSVAWFLSIVIGGALIYSAYMLVCGTLSFWIVKTESVYELVVDNLRGITEFPLTIYNKTVKAILLFVVPYGFVNYVPASGMFFPESSPWPEVVRLLATPVLGAVLFGSALLFFRIGMKRYQSTGS